MTDLDYISLILKGNTAMFAHLIDRYGKMSFAVAYRIIKDPEDSQDIVQESFIAAFENLNTFKGESKFSTWLYRIVTNKALAHKNKKKYFDEVEDQGQLENDYEEDVDIRNEKLVKDALSKLNDKERFVIDMFYYQDQSIKEISLITQSSEVNVKVILHRARKKMNEHIQRIHKFADNE